MVKELLPIGTGLDRAGKNEIDGFGSFILDEKLGIVEELECPYISNTIFVFVNALRGYQSFLKRYKGKTLISSGPDLTAKSHEASHIADPFVIESGSVDQDSSQRPNNENWQNTSLNSSSNNYPSQH